MTPQPQQPIGRCGVYGTAARPDFCESYPSTGDWRPISCAYTFAPDGTRGGSCDPSVCGDDNCCNWPRDAGEPNASLRFEGGLPCKHLTGLTGRVASTRYAQMTSSALWVRGSHLARANAWLWNISRVVEGSDAGLWTGRTLWTLNGVPTKVLRDNAKANGGQLCLKIEGDPVIGLCEVNLTASETAALWRLHQPLWQAAKPAKALDV